MHKHLTWKDRLKIEKALKEGLKPTKSADRLTGISRLRRNGNFYLRQGQAEADDDLLLPSVQRIRTRDE